MSDQKGSFSLTQGGNIISFVALIMFILHLFKINITQAEVEAVVNAVILLTGIIISWIGRYRQGDINIAGVKK